MTEQTQTPAPKPRKPRSPRRKTPPPPGLAVMVWVAVLIFLADQISKYVVVHILKLDLVRAIDVFPPWFNLRMAWNEGINFGLFASGHGVMRYILVAIALIVCVGVTVWINRLRPGRFAQVSAGLLIGGALGNVIDRLIYGAVADFLNMSLPFWTNPYSFNVADIAIFAGAIGLILFPPETAAPKTAKGAKPRDGARKSR